MIIGVAKKFARFKMIWLLRLIYTFHRYAVPLLVAMFLVQTLVIDTAFYFKYYEYLNEFFYMFLLGYLYADALIRDKCRWHYASIMALLSCSIINIIFIGEYDNDYALYYNKIALAVFSICVVVLMFTEKKPQR